MSNKENHEIKTVVSNDKAEINEIERADERERDDEEKNRLNNQLASLDADLKGQEKTKESHEEREEEEKEEVEKPKTLYPDGFEDRYFAIEGKNERTVYADSKGDLELLRDSGDKLRTKTPSELAVKAMIEIAQHRDWKSMDVRGSNEFKREVWLEGQARGIDVKGYKPNELDQQEVKIREERFLGNEISNIEPASDKEVQNEPEQPETEKDKQVVPLKAPEKDIETEAEYLAKREAIEAVVERDLNKKYPNDPDKVKNGLKYARENLDKRKEDGRTLPSFQVRDIEQEKVQPELANKQVQELKQQNTREKKQNRDRDIER